MSPSELAARASPTAPRRSDLPKLDSSLLHMGSQQQFPLPASMPPTSVAALASMMHNSEGGRHSDAEDLRLPSNFLGRGSAMGHAHAMAAAAAAAAASGSHPGSGMGSALLDTYLSMIAAAGGDSSSMAAALGSFPGRAGLFAQAASQMHAPGSGSGLKASALNGKNSDERSDELDREEIASDADISDSEDVPEDNKNMPVQNDEESIAAEDN